MVHFSGFARKMNFISPPFARAKRAQKCLLMRILNLCMVSNHRNQINHKNHISDNSG
ncbi:MAG: hypothetical protein U5L45_18115 [Saprospiraceae bacterium]|nr:hypothetical protein [Saprospiraceae bacterium]